MQSGSDHCWASHLWTFPSFIDSTGLLFNGRRRPMQPSSVLALFTLPNTCFMTTCLSTFMFLAFLEAHHITWCIPHMGQSCSERMYLFIILQAERNNLIILIHTCLLGDNYTTPLNLNKKTCSVLFILKQLDVIFSLCLFVHQDPSEHSHWHLCKQLPVCTGDTFTIAFIRNHVYDTYPVLTII